MHSLEELFQDRIDEMSVKVPDALRRDVFEHAKRCLGAKSKLSPLPVLAPPPLPDSWVVSLDDNVRETAMFTAAMLARPHKHFAGIDAAASALRSEAPRSCLVMTSNLSLDKLSAISLTGVSCGWLAGSRQPTMSMQIGKLIAAMMAAADDERDILFSPTARNSHIAEHDGLIRANGAIDIHEVLSLMMTPKRLLALVSHSDGYSTFLGKSTLCARLDADAHSDGLVSCFSTELCGRLNEPFAGAGKNGRLLPSSLLHAEVMLYAVCFGYVPATPFVTSGGIADQILENPGVTSLLTAVGPLIFDPKMTEDCITRIRRGEPLGDIVADMNAVMLERMGPASYFVLFGDPLQHLGGAHGVIAKREQAQAVKPIADHPPPSCRPCARGDDTGRIQSLKHRAVFLHRYSAQLAKRTEPLPPEGTEELVDQVEKMLTLMDSALDIDAMQNAVATPASIATDILRRQGEAYGTLIMHDWLSSFEEAPSASWRRTCRYCDAMAAGQVWRAPQLGGIERVVETCPICGVTGDRPPDIGVDVAFDRLLLVEGKESRFRFRLSERVDAAACIFQYNPRARSQRLPLQQDDDGWYHASITPALNTPRSNAIVSFIGLAGGGIVIENIPTFVQGSDMS